MPGGQDMKGRLVGKDRERWDSGIHRCIRRNLDPRGQEIRSDQEQQ